MLYIPLIDGENEVTISFDPKSAVYQKKRNNNLLQEFFFDRCLQTEFEGILVKQSCEMRCGKKSVEKIIAEYSFFLELTTIVFFS